MVVFQHHRPPLVDEDLPQSPLPGICQILSVISRTMRSRSPRLMCARLNRLLMSLNWNSATDGSTLSVRLSLPRGEPNDWERTFAGATTWDPGTGRDDIVLDGIGLQNAIAASPELLEPLPEEARRKLRRTRGARRSGATRE